jgi:hypothetical protein
MYKVCLKGPRCIYTLGKYVKESASSRSVSENLFPAENAESDDVNYQQPNAHQT